MSHHHQSTALQIYSCALTGLSPLTDPVVTPSGYICSRKLLLTKLAENGGIDPFDDKGVRRLEECSLIDLAMMNTTTTTTGGKTVVAAVIPPRAPKSTSLPHLLAMMQSEFDAVLLELYDTRHALEETRRELSSALYQNDAAIRVVARLAAERDESRAMLERYLSDPAAGLAGVASSASQKRVREQEDNEEDNVMPVAKKSAKFNTTNNNNDCAESIVMSSSSDLSKIPSSEFDAMSATWKTLTSSRRTITKLKRTPEETSKNEALLTTLEDKGESKKVNLGKASAKAGILCMTSLRTNTTTEYLITGGHDKNAIVYNVSLGKIVATLTGASGDIVTVHGKVVATTEEGSSSIQVVTGSADGHVRLYELMLTTNNKEMEVTLLCTAKLEKGVPVDVVLHPSSTKKDTRVLVASSSGRLELFKWSSDGDGDGDADLKLLTRLESSQEEEGGISIEYTSGCMHPDGFIYAAGTSDGSLIVWDLKSQAVAETLTGHDGLSIDCIAISENGYHVATSSSSTASSNNIHSPIHIWDLRKLKSSATIIPANDVGTVMALAFDPTASYLAYSDETCTTQICVAKDWDQVVCTLAASKKRAPKKGKKDSMGGKMRGAVVWGGQGFGLKEGEGGNVWLAVGCDGERPVRFWGEE